MQVAEPNPAPLHQQMDTDSISIYIKDLVGLVGDVKSPDTLLYFPTPGLRAGLASLQGLLPTKLLPVPSSLQGEEGVGMGGERMGL